MKIPSSTLLYRMLQQLVQHLRTSSLDQLQPLQEEVLEPGRQVLLKKENSCLFRSSVPSTLMELPLKENQILLVLLDFQSGSRSIVFCITTERVGRPPKTLVTAGKTGMSKTLTTATSSVDRPPKKTPLTISDKDSMPTESRFLSPRRLMLVELTPTSSLPPNLDFSHAKEKEAVAATHTSGDALDPKVN